MCTLNTTHSIPTGLRSKLKYFAVLTDSLQLRSKAKVRHKFIAKITDTIEEQNICYLADLFLAYILKNTLRDALRTLDA